MTSRELVLGVVGPCASGKSTLVSALKAMDYQTRHIAQEHSYVNDMWRQIGKPDENGTPNQEISVFRFKNGIPNQFENLKQR